jgi:major membrane immunogen (membrane-anchored lipoprotein)
LEERKMRRWVILLGPMVLLAACNNRDFEKAMEKGNSFLENKEFEKAIATFEMSIDEKTMKLPANC